MFFPRRAPTPWPAGMRRPRPLCGALFVRRIRPSTAVLSKKRRRKCRKCRKPQNANKSKGYRRSERAGGNWRKLAETPRMTGATSRRPGARSDKSRREDRTAAAPTGRNITTWPSPWRRVSTASMPSAPPALQTGGDEEVAQFARRLFGRVADKDLAAAPAEQRAAGRRLPARLRPPPPARRRQGPGVQSLRRRPRLRKPPHDRADRERRHAVPGRFDHQRVQSPRDRRPSAGASRDGGAARPRRRPFGHRGRGRRTGAAPNR